MMPYSDQPIKVAVLDLYDGEPNQGIRALSELLLTHDRRLDNRPLEFDHFETRLQAELPDLSYDVYISSGGPGSPFDGEGKLWERRYFSWIDSVWDHNERIRQRDSGELPKHVLFICHSFQLMCRHFGLGSVVKRHSPSFGIFRVNQTDAGRSDALFADLKDPFYAADFRGWQVVAPDLARLETLGAQIIAMEKIRRHVPYERAVMGIRVSPEFVGVQFHPEADPPGMLVHFQKKAHREEIILKHGEDKYSQIIDRLNDPAFLAHTYERVVPNFLRSAVGRHRAEQVAA